jgi:predicted transcriptional regulator
MDSERLSFFFYQLGGELVTEIKAHNALIEKLEARITELEAKASQSVTIKIDGDIGERLDALEDAIGNALDEDAVERLIDDKIDMAISDKVSDLELEDKIEEYIKGLSFSVTID